MRINKWLLVVATLLLVSCGKKAEITSTNPPITPVDGFAEGTIGDVFSTVWMDFCVNAVSRVDEYGSYVAEEGEDLLVVNLTIKNTTDELLEMYDSDWQISWDDSELFAIPETYWNDVKIAGMLESSYFVDKGKTTMGDLVFAVPEEFAEFRFSFLEYFADETEGSLFVVDFTVE